MIAKAAGMKYKTFGRGYCLSNRYGSVGTPFRKPRDKEFMELIELNKE